MAKRCEGKAGESGANQTSTIKSMKAAPLKLELFEGDAIARCDAETGVCTVPGSADPASEVGEQHEPASEKGVGDHSERSGT